MKRIKIILATAIVLIAFGANAQWNTNGSGIYYNSGNVGIGTTNPLKTLDVSGDVSLGMEGSIFARRQDNSYHEFFSMDNNNDITINRSSGIHGLPSHLLMFIGNEKTFQVKNSSNETIFRINEVNGRVGIGTTWSPQRELEVNGDILLKNSGKIFTKRNDGVHHEIFSMDNNNDITINRSSGMHGLHSHLFMFIGGGKTFQIRNSNNTALLRVEEQTGDIIVDGKITSKEVEVKLDVWADYVFQDDYQLKPLNEVEAFIKENKHLPGIPSEKEIIENGLSVGEMNQKMMEKIEELTLYVIELQKEIETLKQK